MITVWALISVWEEDPPESTVPLTDADAAQHPLLVPHVLTQELANDVSAQTEAHHDQLCLRVRPLNVAHHGGKLPRTTWTGERRGEQLTYDTSKRTVCCSQISSSTKGADATSGLTTFYLTGRVLDFDSLSGASLSLFLFFKSCH